MTTTLRNWLWFGGILVLVFGLVAGAHRYSAGLPGIAGETYRQNIEQNIEATALIYTESGNVRDYLDREHGKYGFEIDMSGHLK